MKTKFQIIAFGLFVLGLTSCEKHDFFDEDNITGQVGPETYWTIESSAVKAGESMGFTAQYYSSVTGIDHSEVWYDLYMKEDKSVSCALIKAVSHSIASSVSEQQRVLQTIQSYPHSEDLWVGKDVNGVLTDNPDASINAYVLKNSFPVSGTLAMVSWVQPKDTIGFTKNLNAYFGADIPTRFKDELTAKLNNGDERNYAAYMQAFQGLGLMTDSTMANQRDTMPYLEWITDSTFDANSASWKKHFKQYDSIFSTTQFDTVIKGIDTVWNTKYNRKTKEYDTIWTYVKDDAGVIIDSIGWKSIDTVVGITPWFERMEYVYDDIKERVDRVWNDSVSFMDLIQGADGYAIEYQKSYYINAELRVYDNNGTYSKTDSKQISIN
jgi:hypothetical protein